MTENSTIRLRRTGSAAVEFQGREIASAGPTDRDATRRHEIRVYALASGCGYVASIAYQTRWQNEIGRDDAYAVEDSAALVAALEQYDPLTGVAGYPPGEQFREKQARLEADLRRRYADQVSEALRQTGITVDVAAISPAWTNQLAMRRYRDLLRRGLSDIELSRGEACLICDAMNGTALFAGIDDHDGTYMFIPAEIEDSIRLDRTDAKWEIDGRALVAKLSGASPATLCAIAEACEQFWARCEEDTDTVLREVGLVRPA